MDDGFLGKSWCLSAGTDGGSSGSTFRLSLPCRTESESPFIIIIPGCIIYSSTIERLYRYFMHMYSIQHCPSSLGLCLCFVLAQ
jgi:hypothetical protein